MLVVRRRTACSVLTIRAAWLGPMQPRSPPDGPLAHQSFHGAYTWASWYLRRLVRERQELSLPEAVRRLTSMPAQTVGLKDRGELRPGFSCIGVGWQVGKSV